MVYTLGQVGYIYMIYQACVLGQRDPLINPRQVRQSQTEFYRHREGKIHASYIFQNPGQATRSAPQRTPNGTLRATSYACWDFGAYFTCTPSTRGIIGWTFWLHGPFIGRQNFSAMPGSELGTFRMQDRRLTNRAPQSLKIGFLNVFLICFFAFVYFCVVFSLSN